MVAYQEQTFSARQAPTWLVLRILLASLAVGFVGVGAELKSDTVMITGFSIGVFSGVIGLWRCLANYKQNWSACELQGSAGLIAYFGGAIITLQTFSRGSFWESGYMSHSDPGILFLASMLVVLYQTVLTLLGFYEHRFWKKSLGSLQGGFRAHSTTVLFLLGLVAAQIWFLASGSVGYRGFQGTSGGQIPIVASIVVALSFGVLGVAGFILGDGRRNFGLGLNLLALGLIIIEMVWIFNFGRRLMAYSIVSMMVMFFWGRAGRSIGIRGIVLGAIMLGVLYIGSTLFIAVRIDLYQYRNRTVSMDTLSRVTGGLDRLLNDSALIKSKTSRNFETRFFVIGYLADLIGGTGPESALYGTNFISLTIAAVPRAIFPIKDEILREIGSSESLVNPRFGLRVEDSADSILVAAYTDFLWFGVIIYPIALLGLGIAYAKLTELTVGMPLMTVFFVSYTFFSFIKTEAPWTEFIVDLRTLVILVVLLMLRQFFLSSYRGR